MRTAPHSRTTQRGINVIFPDQPNRPVALETSQNAAQGVDVAPFAQSFEEPMSRHPWPHPQVKLAPRKGAAVSRERAGLPAPGCELLAAGVKWGLWGALRRPVC